MKTNIESLSGGLMPAFPGLRKNGGQKPASKHHLKLKH